MAGFAPVIYGEGSKVQIQTEPVLRASLQQI